MAGSWQEGATCPCAASGASHHTCRHSRSTALTLQGRSLGPWGPDAPRTSVGHPRLVRLGPHATPPSHTHAHTHSLPHYHGVHTKGREDNPTPANVQSLLPTLGQHFTHVSAQRLPSAGSTLPHLLTQPPVPWKLTSSRYPLATCCPLPSCCHRLEAPPPPGSTPGAGSLPTWFCVPSFWRATQCPGQLNISPAPASLPTSLQRRKGPAPSKEPPERDMQRAGGPRPALAWLWGQPATRLPLHPTGETVERGSPLPYKLK